MLSIGHVVENALELFVGGGEPLATQVQQFLTALSVLAQVVDAAIGVLHLLDQLFKLVDCLGVSDFFHFIQFFLFLFGPACPPFGPVGQPFGPSARYWLKAKS